MTSTDLIPQAERTAVDKALSLLTAFGSQSGAGLGVSELARRAGLTKSTAFRLLGVLQRNGVVERVGCNYRLGRALYELGGHLYSPAHERLGALLTPFVVELYELTHQTVHLGVLRGTDVMYVNLLYGHQRVPCPSRLGGVVPAYCTALGKVLLAYDADATDATLSRGLQSFTEQTIVVPAELQARLAEIRRDGIGFDNGEARVGLTCIAAPVFGPNGRPAAAISVSGAAGRFNPRMHEAALRRVCYAASRALAAARAPRVGGEYPSGVGQAATGSVGLG
ncbi:IclR family transcriptional regulator [Micromonospora sp. NBC_01392]|uniref:IclR family transcriptional regulator n=1 Tax=Micromonospora sp. NBC_01392 TaxID=2903588 RepID=UPI00324B1B0A